MKSLYSFPISCLHTKKPKKFDDHLPFHRCSILYFSFLITLTEIFRKPFTLFFVFDFVALISSENTITLLSLNSTNQAGSAISPFDKPSLLNNFLKAVIAVTLQFCYCSHMSLSAFSFFFIVSNRKNNNYSALCEQKNSQALGSLLLLSLQLHWNSFL